MWGIYSCEIRFSYVYVFLLVIILFGLVHIDKALQETMACFLDPFTLTISAWSAILELKGGFNKIFA